MRYTELYPVQHRELSKRRQHGKHQVITTWEQREIEVELPPFRFLLDSTVKLSFATRRALVRYRLYTHPIHSWNRGFYSGERLVREYVLKGFYEGFVLFPCEAVILSKGSELWGAPPGGCEELPTSVLERYEEVVSFCAFQALRIEGHGCFLGLGFDGKHYLLARWDIEGRPLPTLEEYFVQNRASAQDGLHNSRDREFYQKILGAYAERDQLRGGNVTSEALA